MLPLRSILVVVALITAHPCLHAAPPTAETATAPNTAETSKDDATKDRPAPDKNDIAAGKYWDAIKLLGSKQAADIPKGRDALQAAADLEFSHAQSLLAECLVTGGYGFSKDKRKAANLYRLAAERGNAFAQVSLGQCYYSGVGVRKDSEKATQWLTKALEPEADFSRPTPPPEFLAAQMESASNEEVAGRLDRDPSGEAIAAAHFVLGTIASSAKKTDEAQKHFVAAATAGVDGRSGLFPAAVQAALNYAFGQGTPRDMKKANEMLAISSKLKARSGLYMVHNYTSLKMMDDFAAGDLEDALASEGDKLQSTAQFDIAQSFTKKNSKDYNPAEAAKWYTLAAENGNTWAMLQLAFLLNSSELGKPDPIGGFKWFDKVGGGNKPKHLLGVANLAICYQNGIGTEKDPAKAATLFKKFKNQEIICYLGSIGQCPGSVVTWDGRLNLIDLWAKEKSDPQAQYFLGLRYAQGWDAKPDFNAAVRWFKKASKAGNGAAWFQLGVFHELGWSDDPSDSPAERMQSALECYRKGSEAGDIEALTSYADMFNQGKGVERDLDRAEKLYLRCLEIDPEQARAHNNLATIYQERLVKSLVYADESTACLKAMLAHYEAAARLEQPTAATNLGMLYYEGRFADHDFRKAYSYLEQGAEWGMPNNHYFLGWMHEFGQGVPVTLSEAAYHYRLAALEGNIPALRRLIDFYLTGAIGTVDLDRAYFWLDRLARTGDEGAVIKCTKILLLKRDYNTAVKRLQQMTESNSLNLIGFGCSSLSDCYDQGIGVKVDHSRAKKYYARALEASDGDALARLGLQQIGDGKIEEGVATLQRSASYSSPLGCYRLGQLYYYGTHVQLDTARGLQLMNKAAADNYTDALCFLAGTTCNRVPGAPSLETAISMATQAETYGHPSAKDLREKLEHRLDKKSDDTPEETARARSS